MTIRQKNKSKSLALALATLFLAAFGIAFFPIQVALTANLDLASDGNQATSNISNSKAVSSPAATTVTRTNTPSSNTLTTSIPTKPTATTPTQTASGNKISLDQPNMTDQALIKWATNAARLAYSYDFKNYQEQLQLNQQNFTSAGWKAFMSALNKSNNLQEVQNKKLVAFATSSGQATIVKKGVTNGIYTWEIVIPMLATYENESRILKQNLTITMLIDRTTDTNSGVGISHFVAALVPPIHPTATTIKPGATTAPATTSTTTVTTTPAAPGATTTTPAATTGATSTEQVTAPTTTTALPTATTPPENTTGAPSAAGANTTGTVTSPAGTVGGGTTNTTTNPAPGPATTLPSP
jgi:intracellular multiplication protein IcmL